MPTYLLNANLKTQMLRSQSTKAVKNFSLIFLWTVIIALSAQCIFAQVDISRKDAESGIRGSGNAGSGQTGPPQNVAMTSSFTEGFDGGVIPTGWSVLNRSTVVGTNPTCWNIFGATPWAPQAGAGHIGANFNCAAGNNTISGWLFTPVILFSNGDQVTFWTRKGSPDSFADRLELRLSTNLSSTNVGTTADSVGDFSKLLVSVNPTLVLGVYPTTFTQFTATISGLPGPVNGRLAFRYYVTSGGPDGANSDILSIDTFSYSSTVTAAESSVSGRVVSGGKGLANAKVELTGTGGTKRSVMTNAFGNFTFSAVDSGATYVVNVSAKKYTFAPQVVSVTDNISGLTFTAQ